MLCSKCGHELTEEMFLNEICFNCGFPVSESKRIHKAEIAESTEKGGNAIIGISYDIITFNRDMIGVSVNGTSVVIEQIQ